MITICDRLAHFEAVYEIAHSHDDIWATIGTHPHEARHETDFSAALLIEHCARPKVVGIGECGLDFHYDLSPRDIQESVFRAHIEAAQQTGLPLVIHSREADDIMGKILIETQAQAPYKFLMHCYTSGMELMKIAADLGGWFSVSGIATFKAAQDVREVIKAMPRDRIIIETDCPYLAPVPMRGRRNEPRYTPYIYDALADIIELSQDKTRSIVNAAVFALFDKIIKPEVFCDNNP